MREKLSVVDRDNLMRTAQAFVDHFSAEIKPLDSLELISLKEHVIQYLLYSIETKDNFIKRFFKKIKLRRKFSKRISKKHLKRINSLIWRYSS